MSGPQDGDRGPRRPLELTDAERELLLKACQRYRAAIPSYLKSRDEERLLLDALIARLS